MLPSSVGFLGIGDTPRHGQHFGSLQGLKPNLQVKGLQTRDGKEMPETHNVDFSQFSASAEKAEAIEDHLQVFTAGGGFHWKTHGLGFGSISKLSSPWPERGPP